MTDEPVEPPVETPDAVMPPGATPDVTPDGQEPVEMVSEPAKVMRIGSMVKQLLDEVKAAPLDDASRDRLAGIYQRSLDELATALLPDLQDELRRWPRPSGKVERPSNAELASPRPSWSAGSKGCSMASRPR